MKRGCAVLATSKAQRIADEAAFVLHHYDWSESSLVLEVFTRHYGRVVLVAKGVKRPTSNFRPVLLPLQPLRLTYSGEGEVRTLKSAEWMGGHIMPQGEALFSGYYANELVMRLLPRDDAHARLFDWYAQLVQVLAAGHEGTMGPALRAFELLLLQDTGFLPALDQQTLTLGALQAANAYVLLAEAGLRLAGAGDKVSLPASAWHELSAALEMDAPFMVLLRICAQWPIEWRNALQTQLRALLHYHCGVQTLRTRQVMMDLQNLELR
jgi:DNA repair protein RecO (recombination protein O)